jgi:hypothetical protein
MKLYLAVAALVFAGSLGTYALSQTLGAAGAIGGGPARMTSAQLLSNPLMLLQRDRLRTLLSSNASIGRMEPKFSFDGLDVGRVLRPPSANTQIGRGSWGAVYRPVRPYTPPQVRSFR